MQTTAEAAASTPFFSGELLPRASANPTFASEERQPENYCFPAVDRTTEAFLILRRFSSAGAFVSGTAPYRHSKERQQKTEVFAVPYRLPRHCGQEGLGEP